jgi:6-phosphogluconolactonase
MRFNTTLRSILTGTASFGLAMGLISCSRDYTVGYVYSVSASNGTISAYAIDYQTGILNQISGSPFSSTVSDPVKVVAHPDSQAIYVVGGANGSDGNSVEELLVGSDGKLYGSHTYNLTGTEAPASSGQNPLIGAAVDTTGTFLYVTFAYQQGFTPASPGPGGVTIFPINADHSLGTPTTLNVGHNPVSIAVSAPVCVATPIVSSNPTCTTSAGSASGVYNTYVYVVDQETAAGKPTVLGYAQNMKTGALTPLSQNTTTQAGLLQGVSAGVVPSAIAVDGTASFVYVTDQETNQIYGYTIARATTGNLTAMPSSPFATGSFPVNVVVDPRALFVYTANSNSGTVSAFAINQASGSLSGVAGSNFTARAGTSCVTIDPNLGQYLYASNFVDGSISGAELNGHTGVLSGVANSPFPASSLPSCLVAVGNGSHALSVNFPSTGTAQ